MSQYDHLVEDPKPSQQPLIDTADWQTELAEATAALEGLAAVTSTDDTPDRVWTGIIRDDHAYVTDDALVAERQQGLTRASQALDEASAILDRIEQRNTDQDEEQQ